MAKTVVFVSSTCYDLSQIRKDLEDGIREMGHEPMLSESKDFPVDPLLTSEENCINAVRNYADVFVLIIGNRYGYKLESGKSITNTEYLTAINKGIPVYTFSLKQMVNILPVWKHNRGGDYSHIVDDNKVFEFLEDVREKRSKWNFEFESAQDILSIFKSQMSILFRSSLNSWLRLGGSKPIYPEDLSARSLKLLVEKPEAYEYRLFFQMLQDEVEKYHYLKKDCDHAIHIQSGIFLNESKQYLDWQRNKLTQLHESLDVLNKLFTVLAQYMGEPGVPSDIDGLHYVAKRIGDYYANLLNWVFDVRSAFVPEVFHPLKDLVAKLPLLAIQTLEEWPSTSLQKIESSLRALSEGSLKKGSEINLVLKLGFDEEVLNQFKEEINRLSLNLTDFL